MAGIDVEIYRSKLHVRVLLKSGIIDDHDLQCNMQTKLPPLADLSMPAPRLIYLVTDDWYFVLHRLLMARAAKQAGFEVHVATRVVDHAKAIEREGFILHPLGWRRGVLDPLHLLSAVRQVRGVYQRVRLLAHHVALAPTIIGSVAALGLPIICLNALAGLGFVFTSRTPKAIAIRFIVERQLRWLLGRKDAVVTVENPDDRAAIRALGVNDEKIVLIPGSGVDVDAFTPLPEPPTPPVTVGFAGRLLTDKGVPTLVAAHDLLARRGRPVELLIAGEPDPANPASIPKTTLAEWKKRPGLTFLAIWRISARCGQKRILRFWRRCAKACRLACSKPLPAPARSWQPTSPAAGRSHGQTSTLCWYLRTMLPRWPMPSNGLRAMRICVGALARPAAPWSNANSPTGKSAVRSSRSITGCSSQRSSMGEYCGHRDLPDRQCACVPSAGEP